MQNGPAGNQPRGHSTPFSCLCNSSHTPPVLELRQTQHPFLSFFFFFSTEKLCVTWIRLVSSLYSTAAVRLESREAPEIPNSVEISQAERWAGRRTDGWTDGVSQRAAQRCRPSASCGWGATWRWRSVSW